MAKKRKSSSLLKKPAIRQKETMQVVTGAGARIAGGLATKAICNYAQKIIPEDMHKVINPALTVVGIGVEMFVADKNIQSVAQGMQVIAADKAVTENVPAEMLTKVGLGADEDVNAMFADLARKAEQQTVSAEDFEDDETEDDFDEDFDEDESENPASATYQDGDFD